MKIRFIIMVSVAILVLIIILNMTHYADYQTSLLPGVFIQQKQGVLTANNWSVPLVDDWNNDGKKDLLIGNRTYENKGAGKGYISFYQNSGTDSRPLFDNLNYVKTCTDICSDLTVAPDG